MEKKEYIKPEMNVYQMETQAILAGSNIKIATEDDYDEELRPRRRRPEHEAP